MKKYLAFILLVIFMVATPTAQASTILHWFIKHEIKAEAQDIADQFVPKGTQKEIKKQWKEYKKQKKHDEKMRKKKQKRMAKERKRQEKEKMHGRVQQAQKLNAEENLEFKKYNDPQGSQELDFFGIYGKKQVNTEGVISPDYSKMVYSEVHFYPSLCQLSSELFMIPLQPAQTPVERVLSAQPADKQKLKFYAPGMQTADPQIFRTMTVVDWSADGTKLLTKERIAENLRGFLQTRVWVYDVETQKTYFLENLNKDIENYWKKKGINLSQYKWDITPMGWCDSVVGRDSGKVILVNAYGYKPDKTKVFLGSWLVDYTTGNTSYVKHSWRYKGSQNGWILRRKMQID